MKFYLFEFDSDSGIRNMAVDEALLEAARRLGDPVLRFYAWNEPTLSLGYFQRYEDRRSHPASLDCPAVRRLTGGGAIVHDQELTYSLSVPPKHPFAEDHRLRLYETVHRAAIGVLNDWGIDAFLAGDVEALVREKPDKNVFLCFQRIAPGDVVTGSETLGWTKLLGSAQYRDKYGGVLQHGSLLWQRSASAPELPGLRDLCRKRLPDFQREMARRWKRRIAEDGGIDWTAFSETMLKEMEPSIAILSEKRYADSWVKKR